VFALVVRWLQFASAALLTGTFVFLVVVAGPAPRLDESDVRARFRAFDAGLVRLALWTLALTLAAGGLDLVRQASVASGLGLRESLAPATILAVLGQTRYGTTWLVRQALLVLLALLLLFREGEEGPADWLAVRLEALALAAASLGAIAAAGHAASVDEQPLVAMALDALHLVATGAWLGALLPLAWGLGWARTLPSPVGDRTAAAMTRRFSALGLGAVATLTATGAYATWVQVASVPALLGTGYGRWLLLKLLLFAILLVVAAVNLCVIKPRLNAACATGAGGPGLVGRLRRQVLAEATIGGVILAVVAVLGITTPGRHDVVSWPLSFRFAWDATRTLPGVQTRVAVGSQIAVLGLVAVLLAVIVQRRGRALVATGGALAIGVGVAVALPPIAVDAHPTTYVRPTVPYAAASIAEGRRIYRAQCTACHGVAGWGDGPAAAGLRPPPADLTAKHTGDHTAGDLFWWVSHGIPGSAMPGFTGRVGPEARWDVINYVRLLGAAEAARGYGPVAVARPAVVAPDFAYTTGVGGTGDSRALKDFRGQGPVLVVLFTLPGSLDRLVRLNEIYATLRLAGGEIIGVPIQPVPDLYRQIGDRSIFFPLVVDGAAEAAETYLEFRRDLTAPGQLPEPPVPSHLELLVDRQGYLRARWMPKDGDGWTDPATLVAEIQRLVREAPTAPFPSEHVH
jgi:putative copper export protein/mono/diheme cytochrome c family protein/peroxiredoxin